MRVRAVMAGLLVSLTLAGCGQAPGARGDQAGAQPESGPSPTLVVVTRDELTSLGAKEFVRSGVITTTARRLFNAGLSIQDAQGEYRPYLAEQLPQLDASSWQVFPDGRMETTYRLKPSLRWHDGAPLAAADWVFSWRVYATPELGLATSSPQNRMQEVLAPDDRTVVIRWLQPYLNAGIMDGSDFPALPRHILDPVYQSADATTFTGQSFWTTQYVGLGPYRLDRWEPGAFIEGSAFEGHALGRPVIDKVKLQWMPDPNTLVANLLAGGAHIGVDGSLRFEQGALLHEQWSQRGGGGTVLFSPGSNPRHTQVQMRPELANPRGLLDVRVRRAVVHAIDRQALVDGLFRGQGLAANAIVSTREPYSPDVDRVIAKYPHDSRRAEQLMNEAGFSKEVDGFFASPDQGRFAIELRILASTQYEAEIQIMADSLRRAGMDASITILPSVQARDRQLRASFSGLQTTTEPSLSNLTTANIPGPANRWQAGANFGGWSNPVYDRLYDTYSITLDLRQRYQLIIEMAKMASEEVPDIPLYYNPSVVAYLTSLVGIAKEPVSVEAAAWNVHQWQTK